MKGYCVKCRKKVEMKDEKKSKTKRGVTMTKGVCSICGTRVCHIGGWVKIPKSKKFKKLLSSVVGTYSGKKVPPMYKDKYGKVYSKKEAKSIAYAIARKLKFKGV